MLDALVLVPFGVALWVLSRQQIKQQEIIGTLETTIVNQRQELDRLSRLGKSKIYTRLIIYSTLAAAGVYGCFHALKYIHSHASSVGDRDLPPETYTPSLARHEKEECVICMKHKRDTFLEPCRHLCVCWVCSREVRDCPICRQTIEKREFTFIP